MSDLDAFKVTFDFYVFAEDLGAAGKQVKAWRPLAQAAGFDPGSGSVKKASARDVQSLEHLAQALAGARSRLIASERQRSAALRGLTKTLGGELDTAKEFLAAVESTSGPLQGAMADTLAKLGCCA